MDKSDVKKMKPSAYKSMMIKKFGLNKEKSTGQSTVPVVSTQVSRLGNPMQESINLLHDWKTLSGIK